MARLNFDDVPQVKRRRANFNLSHRVATSMKVGKLTPIDIVEVLPGDTWSVTPASLTRLSRPLIRPIMDDLYLDSYSFFVPLRLCYNQLEEVFGDSSPSSYESLDLSSIPSLMFGAVPGTAEGAYSGSVADYLGLPTNLSYDGEASQSWTSDISVLPFRAFALIWNEFFRDQNVDPETYVELGSLSGNESQLNNDDWGPDNYMGMLPPVRRYGDYFSTALPGPQKGPSVKIPGIRYAPVTASNSNIDVGNHPQPLRFADEYGYAVPTGTVSVNNGRFSYNATMQPPASSATLTPTNLRVASEGADGTINGLRTAFQLQKYLERDALYGSRYREYLYAAYGVTSPDSRLQVPEFLAGAHNRMNIQSIPSTANTSNVPQGTFAANISSLSEKSGGFSKSFTEHGYIITVACIRYKHLYSQSVSRLWRRSDRDDFYDPLFSNLGMQAILDQDVFGVSDAPSTPAAQVFGYQEAYADYRTILDRVSGQMRPDRGNLGQFWSLADRFESIPSLIDLVHEDSTSFDRVLAVSQEVEDPFVVDFNFRCSVARVVSPYSMPGYVDHH